MRQSYLGRPRRGDGKGLAKTRAIELTSKVMERTHAERSRVADYLGLLADA